MLDAALSETALLYGLLPESHLVDKECCLATTNGLAAVHLYAGALEDIAWVGSCLEELAKRNIKGLGMLLRTTAGELVAQVAKQHVFLTNYVPGACCDNTNTFEVRAIGRLLGEVHRASDDVLYFFPPPENRVSPLWRLGARERAAYWQLAMHKYRQAARGEALRQLLYDAETALCTLEELEKSYDSPPVLSFVRLLYSKFVYVNAAHTVHLNYAHDLFVEPNFVSLGELLIDSSYNADTCLHLLSAYQAIHPISDLEWQMLLAFLTYPHEWAEELDDMTRGRPLLKGTTTLEQLHHKRDWLEWLREHCALTKRIDKGGLVMKSEERRPEAVPNVEATPIPHPNEEIITDKTEAPETPSTTEPEAQGEVAEQGEAGPQVTEQEPQPVIEKPKPSIVWKPFPRPLGAKQEDSPTEEAPVPNGSELPE